MKITIEHLGNKVQVEDETIHDVCDVIDLFEKALMEVGFQKERIQGGFLWKARHIEENRDSE